MTVAITEDLVSRATAGDTCAITDLLRLAQTDIRRYARRSCRSHSDAEEAVQETLIVLYRKVGTLREVGAISGWLFRIVNRYCIRLTMRILGVPFAQEAEAIDRRFARTPTHELRLDIARAIESLPPHYRQMVVLRDMEERTIDEIAEKLATTRETVKARIHRARGLLREYLREDR
ncbi:MAG: RNA polymerase sigma factor [Phenylobacterium sp.]|uniref:RNA polymerase sigma factor n=1 Tax=Phenylobacterium sp. TaxID=1871053 RepID=UPI003BB6C713